MDISIICRNDKFLPVLAETSYNGIDMPVSDMERMFTDDYHDQIIATYKASLACGLRICQTHLPFWPAHYAPIGDGTYEAFEAYMLPRIIRAIELSEKVGSRTAVLHPYYTDERKTSVEGNLRLIEKIIPTLERTGIILSLENIYNNDLCDAFVSTADDLLFYTEYFHHNKLGICLDTGHALILKQDPNELLDAVKHRLTALHIHSVTFDNDLHTVPGITGGVDWHRFAESLYSSPYEGSFNMEVKIPPCYNMRLAKSFYQFAYDVAHEIVNGTF